MTTRIKIYFFVPPWRKHVRIKSCSAVNHTITVQTVWPLFCKFYLSSVSCTTSHNEFAWLLTFIQIRHNWITWGSLWMTLPLSSQAKHVRGQSIKFSWKCYPRFKQRVKSNAFIWSFGGFLVGWIIYIATLQHYCATQVKEK